MIRRERWLLSRDGRHFNNRRMLLWLIVVPQIQFAYLAVGRLTPIKSVRLGSGQRGQRPAPAGELTGDRDVGHDTGFLAFVEAAPLLM
jgi:hypothetical protein